MRSRTLARTAAAAAAFIMLAAEPAAAQYADPDGPVAVDDATPARGASMTVSGSGYAPLSVVDVYVFSTPKRLTSVRTDGNGAFTVTVQLPADLPDGNHTVQAVGVDPSGAPRVLSTPIVVGATQEATTSAPTGGSALPRTGVAVGSLVLAGAGLIGAGSATRRAARRRG